MSRRYSSFPPCHLHGGSRTALLYFILTKLQSFTLYNLNSNFRPYKIQIMVHISIYHQLTCEVLLISVIHCIALHCIALMTTHGRWPSRQKHVYAIKSKMLSSKSKAVLHTTQVLGGGGGGIAPTSS
jgi:hypothetical protein